MDRNEWLPVRGKTDLTHPLPGVVDDDRAALAQLLAAKSAVALFVLAVRVAITARLAVGLKAIAVRMTVAIAVRVTSLELGRVTEERDEDHARDRHVVLERVEEEDESAEEREEREREAGRQRVPNQHTK